MSLVVNNNLMAANVARNLNIHYGNLSTSTERLSSGLRINSAADDAAGLAIRELQRADITTLYQGARNANDAVSLIQTADGALQTIDEQLIRMKELAEQAATGTYNSTQRLMIESEYQQLASEITRISNTTDFNGIKLLDGTLSGEYDGSELKSVGELKVHFGTSNDSAEDFYHINIGDTRSAALGLGNELVIQSELETNPTNAGYEELRDRSVKQIYDATYEEQYTAHYNEIYGNLVSTADPAKPAIPMEQAAAQAAEQAALLAAKEATADAEMTKATLDKVFDYTYASVYASDKRTADFHGATTPDATQIADHEAAAQDALKAATDQMYAITQRIAEDGNLSSLDAMLPMPTVTYQDSAAVPADILTVPGVSAFPVQTASSVDAYMEQLGKEAYESTYDMIYNGYTAATGAAAPNDTVQVVGMYENAITNAKTALGLDPAASLTEEQTVAIQEMVHKLAHNKAMEWSEAIQTGAQKVYNDVYHEVDAAGLPTANSYTGQYNANIANGMPPDIAQIMAENTVANNNEEIPTAGAWFDLTEAVDNGATGLYAIDPTTGTKKTADAAALSTAFDISVTMDIPNSGNPPKQVTAATDEVTGTAAALTAYNAGTVAAEAATKAVYGTGYIPEVPAVPGPAAPAVPGTGLAGKMETVAGQNGYMDTTSGTRGLNGNAQGLIETAEYFADAFDGFSPAGSTISTQEAAGDALDAINEAIVSKDKIRAHLGAIQNRLEETINNLNIQAENLQASESRISDVDVAVEMTEFVRNQILTQSAVAMLSQANSLPQMAQQIISGG